MSGGGLILLDCVSDGAGGGTLGPLAWSNIFAIDFGQTNFQTVSGITGTISLAGTITGSGTLRVVQNGTYSAYAGPFAAHNGDLIAWAVQNSTTASVSGSVTVSNSGAVVDSFTYTVKHS